MNKLIRSVSAAGAHFGQPGYETDLLYLAEPHISDMLDES